MLAFRMCNFTLCKELLLHVSILQSLPVVFFFHHSHFCFMLCESLESFVLQKDVPASLLKSLIKFWCPKFSEKLTMYVVPA